MIVVHVHVSVNPEHADAFLAATLENARGSVREPGVVRFDVLRQQDDPARFLIVEIFRDADAPARHKETAHYAAWRDAVAEMMAEPRRSVKYEAAFPEVGRWEYPPAGR